MNTDKKGGFLMGFVTRVLAEAVWYFVGLDLGQSLDHSALAVVERADLTLDEIDHVTYERLKPVILTGGEWASQAEGVWCVPKQDLVAGLRLMLEKRELGLPAKLGASRLLVKEMAEMESWQGGRGGLKFGARREGAHDDLVMASALACWRARRRAPGIWGTKSLGLSH